MPHKIIEEILYGLHISVRNWSTEAGQEKHEIILLPIYINVKLTTKGLRICVWNTSFETLLLKTTTSILFYSILFSLQQFTSLT
jgi:hypothetical protein